MMKSILIPLLMLLSSAASAETVFSNSVSTYAQNVGSRVTVQMKSVNGSSARLNIQKPFTYSNGITAQSFSFQFSGSTPFKITNQFNSTVNTFSNVVPSFKFD